MAISLTSTSTTSTITANSADILTSDSSGEVSLRTGGSLKEIPVAVKDALNATGTAPIYAARAWVNFDGTTATPSTIRGSGNVSSVARNATGDYTVNFTTAMPDRNYSLIATSGQTGGGTTTNVSIGVYTTSTGASTPFSSYQTNSIRVLNRAGTSTLINADAISVCILR
jgi:hypothetical protein